MLKVRSHFADPQQIHCRFADLVKQKSASDLRPNPQLCERILKVNARRLDRLRIFRSAFACGNSADYCYSSKVDETKKFNPHPANKKLSVYAADLLIYFKGEVKICNKLPVFADFAA